MTAPRAMGTTDGIDLSPDGNTLYVGESNTGQVWAYAIRGNELTNALALATAFALAMPVGWDGEKKARSAGLRTFSLVAMASCGFVQASENLLMHSPDGWRKSSKA